MINKLTQINVAPPGGFKGFGPLGLEGKSASDAPNVFNLVISTTIGVITAIGFIYFTINIILSAIDMIVAGGDKQKFTDARKKITNNIIGVVVLISGIFVVSLVGQVFGIAILDPTSLLGI